MTKTAEPEYFRAWVTKYALTRGVFEIAAELCDADIEMISDNSRRCRYYHGEDRDWHRTLEGAQAKAHAMRNAKIASLKKQLKKLESMTFPLPLVEKP